jgi:NTP pyrophosphatase (non-canonical NTP hydrolase)
MGLSIEMDISDYQTQAVKTAIYKHDVIYPALGLANEAGEVLGKIKKVLRDNDGDFTAEKREEIGAEIGDVLWYIAALARDLGIPLEKIAQDNLDKLNSRMARGVLGGSGDNR